MEAQEDDVRHGADGEDILSEEAGTLVGPAAADSVQVRGRALDGGGTQEAVRRVKDVGKRALVALQPQEHIHQDGLVPSAAQSPADTAAGDQGNLALGGKSTGQNHDLHGKALLLPRSGALRLGVKPTMDGPRRPVEGASPSPRAFHGQYNNAIV